MRNAQVINQLARSSSLNDIILKEAKQTQIADAIRQYFPKLFSSLKGPLQHLLKDSDLFAKVHKICELYSEIEVKVEIVEQQLINKTSQTSDEKGLGVNKKITRAALARRHEKTQQEIKKDQIFIRLTPKSQACIQFMLCNRNFPRMEVKLSCNQHLEYLINYLTNKWLRGKVGYKVVLYPDNSFLKAISINEKEKAVKEPFNNYLMFTDIMTCCGVNQNGVLNMNYEIVQAKKQNNKQLLLTPQNTKSKIRLQISREQLSSNERVFAKKSYNFPEISNSFVDKIDKVDDRQQILPLKISSPLKYTYKDELPDYGIYNKNSNFYLNNEESIFGCSLGFNYNISKKEEHHYFANSVNYFDSYVHELKKNDEQKQKQESSNRKKQSQNNKLQNVIKVQNRESMREENQCVKEKKQQQGNGEKNNKQEPVFQDKKLGTLMSIIEIVEKEKDKNSQQIIDEPQNNNSNRFKEVKTVNIVKKKNNNN